MLLLLRVVILQKQRQRQSLSHNTQNATTKLFLSSKKAVILFKKLRNRLNLTEKDYFLFLSNKLPSPNRAIVAGSGTS